ncbi:MOSC domain-containing protein [Aliarcobacter cryaerophilus]|uniref:MOSC domain-containing protein n=1 Tax=Aliarcobacter cryaerophilus TaxID=28198 RepID=UPI00164C5F07|nr:MOSC domain-containing protein [Aliarcobacter cryaerophilus]QNK85729.1 MOSC domain-containing protein [Aliarcobacter cryaerophilus]
MKILGEVLEVFSATKESSGLPRPKVESLNLIKDYGIEFDKFAEKNLDQTVMIVGLKSYELAKSFNIDLELGSLGENILLDFDPHDFEVGKYFKIDEAIIQITQICTVCNHLSVFNKDLPKILKGHRGVYCKITESGKILKNMKVKEV